MSAVAATMERLRWGPRQVARLGMVARHPRVLLRAAARRGARARRAAARRPARRRVRHLGGDARRRTARLGRASPSACSGSLLGVLATRSSGTHLHIVVVVGRARRLDARLGDAADVRRDRRHVLRAQRRREHRPRGDDALRRVLRRARRRQVQLVGDGRPRSRRSPAAASRSCTRSSRSTCAPTRSSAAPRSTSSRSASPATSSSRSTATWARRATCRGSRT